MMNTSTYVRQHFMLYPQTPIVTTKAMKLLGLEDRPAGQNCVVAVLPFDGYNIEDAIVLSQASVDRGLGRTFFYRIYESEAKHILEECVITLRSQILRITFVDTKAKDHIACWKMMELFLQNHLLLEEISS